MNARVSSFFFLCVFFMAPSLALAHHSITAEFDPSKTIELKGTITEVDWVNPHVYIHVDVADATGKIANWSFETYPPAVLKRGGINREAFKEGQVVTIDCFPPKDGTSNLAYLKHITFPDGHSVEIWIGDPSKVK